MERALADLPTVQSRGPLSQANRHKPEYPLLHGKAPKQQSAIHARPVSGATLDNLQSTLTEMRHCFMRSKPELRSPGSVLKVLPRSSRG
eukprot:6939816-Alexandrium_andersonii.AAC.1